MGTHRRTLEERCETIGSSFVGKDYVVVFGCAIEQRGQHPDAIGTISLDVHNEQPRRGGGSDRFVERVDDCSRRRRRLINDDDGDVVDEWNRRRVVDVTQRESGFVISWKYLRRGSGASSAFSIYLNLRRNFSNFSHNAEHRTADESRGSVSPRVLAQNSPERAL